MYSGKIAVPPGGGGLRTKLVLLMKLGGTGEFTKHAVIEYGRPKLLRCVLFTPTEDILINSGFVI
jgi:hypothetical protein